MADAADATNIRLNGAARLRAERPEINAGARAGTLMPQWSRPVKGGATPRTVAASE